MIYLDYSATTPTEKEVLETFNKVTETYIGNPNYMHNLGVEAKKLIDDATKQVASILGVKPSEVIYTSGASEANNTAIKGICLKYASRGKHIITTKLEHSSVIAPISYLQSQGFEVDFVRINDDGLVDLNDLKRLIRDDTILVSIASVNSEVGISQPINEIGKILRNYPKLYFHSDITQSVGKEVIDLTYVDLASFSAQKFYGIKGIGALIKKENIVIEPLIHGGKSTTVFRSGTPPTALIVSLSKALRLIYDNFSDRVNYVCKLNNYLREHLMNIDKIHINSTENSVPHIINFSVLNIKPEVMQHALEEEGIYISTQTACSNNAEALSQAVYAVTKSSDLAEHSLRVSLSHLTTKEEIDKFLEVLQIKLNELGALYESN